MNIFNFLYSIVTHASESVGNFFATFFIMSIFILSTIAVIAEIGKFKPINIIRKSKLNKKDNISDNIVKGNNKEEVLDNIENEVKADETQRIVYDLLVDAYDRYKNNQTGTEQDS